MNRKPILYFYTNMPTPYQLDFFSELKSCFDLRVVYFTVRESDRQWQLSTSGEGYKVHVLRNSRFALWVQKRISSFHFSREIISILRKEDVDYVLVNGTYWSPNVVLALYISFKRKKKVVFWSEPIFPVSNRLGFLLKKIMLWPVRHYSNTLFAIGKKAEQAFRQYGYKKQIHNIPYNIDVGLFNVDNLQQDVLQKLVTQYKSNGEVVFLTSGSLIHRKGIDTVIRAFIQLPAHLKVQLIIMGDGEERENLMSLCNGNNNIHFIGFQGKEMVPYWFQLSDAFVFASRYDGWGLVINEALAAERAIICSKEIGAATDKLIDRYNALLIESEDVNAFRSAMEQLVTNTELRNELIENSRPLKTELSSEYNARKVYDIFRASNEI